MNTQTIPRILLAGTGSGCGKTTITCAVLKALVNRGLKIRSFKCGPDYIDTMFHSRITGKPSANLDSFFFDDNTLNYLLAENAKEAELSIIEGVMGFYDGLSLTTHRCSTCEVSQKTKTPAVLVVDAKGASLSVLAVIHGFLSFTNENNICGVILNRCTAMTYKLLKEAIENRFEGRVKPLGFLPAVPESALESRHLGLVTAAEVADLEAKMEKLAQAAESSIDLDGLIALAKTAPAVSFEEPQLPSLEPVRIGVARDKAFCFYYEDSLFLLKKMGAVLVPFSPLKDAALPEGLHGLYLGGGYPELYAKALSENASMRASVKKAIERGLPTIAECGGFMYLTQAIAEAPMAGLLEGSSFDAGKLVRFGYIHLKAKKDCLLCKAGEEIPGHEFHHWDCTVPGADFKAEKENGRSWDCAVSTDTLYAGYPHFHFYANPDFGINFYRACLKEKQK